MCMLSARQVLSRSSAMQSSRPALCDGTYLDCCALHAPLKTRALCRGTQSRSEEQDSFHKGSVSMKRQQ